jgi:GAF domain-containing protein
VHIYFYIAYSDPRFNQEVDKITGYQTQTVLSVPMINRDQEIIGVIQAINKLPVGFVFSNEDVVQLQSFATLAASTLQKSNQMFELTELLQEQRIAIHYYQCMLQSGNDATITIGMDSRAVR